jgi:hypothetical protein
MSRELYNALVSLVEEQTDSIMEDVNAVLANYTQKDLQEAVLLKDNSAWLPIHYACWNNAPVEVIRLLLDNDDDKKTILEKDNIGRLPIHVACLTRATVEVIQLLLDSDAEKKSIFERDNEGRLPIHLACEGKCICRGDSIVAASQYV